MQERGSKKTFLEQLQELDAPTKKKVLLTSTVIVILLVTYVWLGYFNNIIAGISQDAVASTNPPAAAGPGFWGTMANGAAYMYGEVANGVEGFFGFFKSPGQYSINPK